MKRILLAGLLLTGAAGCSKKGADPTPTIVGKWAFVHQQLVTVYADGSRSPTTSATQNGSDIDEYTEDGTYRGSYNAYYNQRYTLVGDTLTRGASGHFKFFVQKITKDSLVLRFKVSTTSENGAPGSIHSKLSFIRLK
jgi:hypothetical protein